MKDIKQTAEKLIEYAKTKLELKERDSEYKANRLLEIIQSGIEGAELEDAVYGELSILPSEIDERFSEIAKESGSKAATEWLYNYCINNKYVKKDVLDKNPRFDTQNGLTITINKAKPEFRDPKKAKVGNSVDGGFVNSTTFAIKKVYCSLFLCLKTGRINLL